MAHRGGDHGKAWAATALPPTSPLPDLRERRDPVTVRSAGGRYGAEFKEHDAASRKRAQEILACPCKHVHPQTGIPESRTFYHLRRWIAGVVRGVL